MSQFYNPNTGQMDVPFAGLRQDWQNLSTSQQRREARNQLTQDMGIGNPMNLWEQRDLDYLNDVVDDDMSAYTPTRNANLDLAWAEYNKGENQSTIEQLGKGVTGRFLSIAPKLGRAYGSIAGIGEAIIEGSLDPITDNEITRYMEEKDQNLRDGWFKLHNTRDYATGTLLDKLGTAKFWSEDVADGVAYAVSAYLQGAGLGLLGKGLTGATRLKQMQQLAGKALNAKQRWAAGKNAGLNPFWNGVAQVNKSLDNMSKISGIVPENLSSAAALAYNTIGEASAEASEMKTTLRDLKAKELGYDSYEDLNRVSHNDEGYGIQLAMDDEQKNLIRQQIDQEISPYVAQVFKGNAIGLILPNALQTKAFHGTKGAAAKELWRQVKNKTLTKPTVAKGILEVTKNAGSEYWEETQQLNLHRAVEANFEAGDENASPFDVGVEGVMRAMNNISNDEDVTSGFIGALMGTVQGIKGAVGERGDYTRAEEEFDKRKKAWYQSPDDKTINGRTVEDINKALIANHKSEFTPKLDKEGKLVGVKTNPELDHNLAVTRLLNENAVEDINASILDNEYGRAEATKQDMLARAAYGYFASNYYDNTSEAAEDAKKNLEETFRTLKPEEDKIKKEDGISTKELEMLELKKSQIDKYKKIFDDLENTGKNLYSQKGATEETIELAKKIAYAKEARAASMEAFLDEEMQKYKNVDNEDLPAHIRATQNQLDAHKSLTKFQIMSASHNDVLDFKKAEKTKSNLLDKRNADKDYSKTLKMAQGIELEKAFKKALIKKLESKDLKEEEKTTLSEELEALNKNLETHEKEFNKAAEKLGNKEELLQINSAEEIIQEELNFIYGTKLSPFLTEEANFDVEKEGLATKKYKEVAGALQTHLNTQNSVITYKKVKSPITPDDFVKQAYGGRELVSTETNQLIAKTLRDTLEPTALGLFEVFQETLKNGDANSESTNKLKEQYKQQTDPNLLNRKGILFSGQNFQYFDQNVPAGKLDAMYTNLIQLLRNNLVSIESLNNLKSHLEHLTQNSNNSEIKKYLKILDTMVQIVNPNIETTRELLQELYLSNFELNESNDNTEYFSIKPDLNDYNGLLGSSLMPVLPDWEDTQNGIPVKEDKTKFLNHLLQQKDNKGETVAEKLSNLEDNKLSEEETKDLFNSALNSLSTETMQASNLAELSQLISLGADMLLKNFEQAQEINKKTAAEVEANAHKYSPQKNLGDLSKYKNHEWLQLEFLSSKINELNEILTSIKNDEDYDNDSETAKLLQQLTQLEEGYKYRITKGDLSTYTNQNELNSYLEKITELKNLFEKQHKRAVLNNKKNAVKGRNNSMSKMLNMINKDLMSEEDINLLGLNELHETLISNPIEYEEIRQNWHKTLNFFSNRTSSLPILNKAIKDIKNKITNNLNQSKTKINLKAISNLSSAPELLFSRIFIDSSKVIDYTNTAWETLNNPISQYTQDKNISVLIEQLEDMQNNPNKYAEIIFHDSVTDTEQELQNFIDAAKQFKEWENLNLLKNLASSKVDLKNAIITIENLSLSDESIILSEEQEFNLIKSLIALSKDEKIQQQENIEYIEEINIKIKEIEKDAGIEEDAKKATLNILNTYKLEKSNPFNASILLEGYGGTGKTRVFTNWLLKILHEQANLTAEIKEEDYNITNETDIFKSEKLTKILKLKENVLNQVSNNKMGSLIDKMINTGNKLSKTKTKWKIGDYRAIYANREIVNIIFETGEEVLFYKSTGRGSGQESKDEWVPFPGLALRGEGKETTGYFMKQKYKKKNPKLTKYEVPVFKEISEKLKSKTKLFDAETLKIDLEAQAAVKNLTNKIELEVQPKIDKESDNFSSTQQELLKEAEQFDNTALIGSGSAVAEGAITTKPNDLDFVIYDKDDTEFKKIIKYLKAKTKTNKVKYKINKDSLGRVQSIEAVIDGEKVQYLNLLEQNDFLNALDENFNFDAKGVSWDTFFKEHIVDGVLTVDFDKKYQKQRKIKRTVIRTEKDLVFNKNKDVAAFGNLINETINLNGSILDSWERPSTVPITSDLIKAEIKNGNLTIDNIELTNDTTKIIVLDELYAVSAENTRKLLKKFHTLNKTRAELGLSAIKIIGLGDPDQLAENGKSSREAFIGAGALGYTSGLTYVGPLIQVQRSGNMEIYKLSQEYKSKRQKVTTRNTVSSKPKGYGNAKGVMSSSIQDDYTSTLDATINTQPDKSKILVVFDKIKVQNLKEKYKDIANLRVFHVTEVKGEQADLVFIDTFGHDMQIESYNTAMYTALTRAHEFVYLNAPGYDTRVDFKLGSAPKVVDRGNFKNSLDSYLENLKPIKNIYGIKEAVKTEKKTEEKPDKEKTKEEKKEDLEEKVKTENLNEEKLNNTTDEVVEPEEIEKQEDIETTEEEVTSDDLTNTKSIETPPSIQEEEDLPAHMLKIRFPTSYAIKPTDVDGKTISTIKQGDNIQLIQFIDKSGEISIRAVANKNGVFYDLGILMPYDIEAFGLTKPNEILEGVVNKTSGRIEPKNPITDINNYTFNKDNQPKTFKVHADTTYLKVAYHSTNEKDDTFIPQEQLIERKENSKGTLNYIIRKIKEHVGDAEITSVKIHIPKDEQDYGKLGKPYARVTIKGRTAPIFISSIGRELDSTDGWVLDPVINLYNLIIEAQTKLPESFDWENIELQQVIMRYKKALKLVEDKNGEFKVEIKENYKPVLTEVDEYHSEFVKKIEDRDLFNSYAIEIAKHFYGPKITNLSLNKASNITAFNEELEVSEEILETLTDSSKDSFNKTNKFNAEDIKNLIHDTTNFMVTNILEFMESNDIQIVNDRETITRIVKSYLGGQKSVNLRSGEAAGELNIKGRDVKKLLWVLRDFGMTHKVPKSNLLKKTLELYNTEVNKSIIEITNRGTLNILSEDSNLPVKFASLTAAKGKTQNAITYISKGNSSEENGLTNLVKDKDAKGESKFYKRGKPLLSGTNRETKKVAKVRTIIRLVDHALFGATRFKSKDQGNITINNAEEIIILADNYLNFINNYSIYELENLTDDISGQTAQDLESYAKIKNAIENAKNEDEVLTNLKNAVDIHTSNKTSNLVIEELRDTIAIAFNKLANMQAQELAESRLQLKDLERIITMNENKVNKQGLRVSLVRHSITNKKGEINKHFVGNFETGSLKDTVELWDTKKQEFKTDSLHFNFFNKNLNTQFDKITPTTIYLEDDTNIPKQPKQSETEPNLENLENLDDDTLNLDENDFKFVKDTDVLNADYIKIKAALDYARKVLGDQAEEVIQFAELELLRHIAGDKSIYGFYKNGIIGALVDNLGNPNVKVLAHEIFHKVFNEVLPAELKDKAYKALAEESSYYRTLYEKGDDSSLEKLEEILALRYQNYANVKNNTIKNIFRWIRNFIQKLFNNLDTIDSIFYEIDSGNYSKTKFNNVKITRYMTELTKRFGTVEVAKKAYEIVKNNLTHVAKNGKLVKIPNSEHEVIVTKIKEDEKGKPVEVSEVVKIESKTLQVKLNKQEQLSFITKGLFLTESSEASEFKDMNPFEQAEKVRKTIAKSLIKLREVLKNNDLPYENSNDLDKWLPIITKFKAFLVERNAPLDKNPVLKQFNTIYSHYSRLQPFYAALETLKNEDNVKFLLEQIYSKKLNKEEEDAIQTLEDEEIEKYQNLTETSERAELLEKLIKDSNKTNWKNHLDTRIKDYLIGVKYFTASGEQIEMRWQESYARLLFMFQNQEISADTNLKEILRARAIEVEGKITPQAEALIKVFTDLVAASDSNVYTVNINNKPTNVTLSRDRIRFISNKYAIVPVKENAENLNNTDLDLPEGFHREAVTLAKEFKRIRDIYANIELETETDTEVIYPKIEINVITTPEIEEFLRNPEKVLAYDLEETIKNKGRYENNENFHTRLIEKYNLNPNEVFLKANQVGARNTLSEFVSHFASLAENKYVMGNFDKIKGKVFGSNLESFSSSTSKANFLLEAIASKFASLQGDNLRQAVTYFQIGSLSTDSTLKSSADIARRSEHIEASIPGISKEAATLKALLEFLDLDTRGINFLSSKAKIAGRSLADIILPGKGRQNATEDSILRQKSRQVLDAETNEDLTENITVQTILQDYRSKLKTIANNLFEEDNFTGNTGVKSSDGDTIYKFVPASNSKRVFGYLKAKHTEERTADILEQPEILEDSILKMNPFVSDNKNHLILDQVYWNGIDNIWGDFRRKIAFKSEAMPDTLERIGVHGFLSYLQGKTNSYLQFGYTKSNKNDVLGVEVPILSKTQVKEALFIMAKQWIARPERSDKGDYRRDTFTNMEILEGLITRDMSDTDLKKVLEAEIDAKFDKMASDLLEDMLDVGVMFPNLKLDKSELFKEGYIEGASKFDLINVLKLTNPKSTEYSPAKAKEKLLPFIKLFVANNYVNSYFTSQLILGDMSHYSTSGKVVKRMSIADNNSATPSNFKHGMKPNFNIYVAKDKTTPVKLEREQVETEEGTQEQVVKDEELLYTFEETLKNFNISDEAIQNILKQAPDNIEDYDGSAFILPEMEEQMVLGYGRNYGIIGVQKPVISGVVSKEVQKETYKDPFLAKVATFTLSESLQNTYPELRNMVNNMRKNKIEILAVQSGVKVFEPAVNSQVEEFLNEDASIEVNESSLVTLKSNSIRMQLNPKHGIDERTKLFLQLMYFANPLHKNKEETNALYKYAGKLIRLATEDYLNKVKDTTSEKGIIGLLKTALESGNNEELSNLITEFAEAGITGVWNYPGVDILSISKFASYLDKKVVKIDFPGTDLILRADAGIYINGITPTVNRKLKEANITETELREALVDRKKGDAKPLEINLSEAQLEEFEQRRRPLTIRPGKDGLVLVEVVLPKGLLPAEVESQIEKLLIKGDRKQLFETGDMLGWRIPSSELHNGAVVVVSGFYEDEHNSNIIITPKELTLLHGSDFDVDSLYVAARNYFRKPVFIGEALIEIKKINDEIDVLKKKSETLKESNRNIIDKNTLYLGALNSEDLNLKTSEKAIKYIEDEFTDIAKLETSILELTEEIATLKTTVPNLNLNELKEYYKNVRELNKQLNKYRASIKSSTDNLESLRAEAELLSIHTGVEGSKIFLDNIQEADIDNNIIHSEFADYIKELKNKKKSIKPSISYKGVKFNLDKGNFVGYVTNVKTESANEYEFNTLFEDALDAIEAKYPDQKVQLDKLRKQFYENAVLENMMKVMGKNTERMLELISHKKIENSIAKAASKLFNIPNLKKALEKLQGKFDLSNPRDNAKTTGASRVGDVSIGIVANFTKQLSYIWHANKGLPIYKIKTTQDQTAITIEGEKHTSYSGLSEYEINPNTGELDKSSFVLTSNDAILQINLDNVNTNIASPANITPNTIGAYLILTSMGISQDVLAKIMLQPVITQITKYRKNKAITPVQEKLNKLRDIKEVDELKGDITISIKELDEALEFTNEKTLTELKDGSEESIKVLETQQKVLNIFETSYELAQDAAKLTKLMSLQKNMPNTEEDIEIMSDTINAIFDTTELDFKNITIEDVENLQLKSTFNIEAPNLLKDVPHLKEVIYMFLKFKNILNTISYRHSDKITKLTDRIATNLASETDYSIKEVKVQIRNEIIKYIASGVNIEEGSNDIEISTIKNANTGEIMYGKEAYYQNIRNKITALISYNLNNPTKDEHLELLFKGLNISPTGNIEIHNKLQSDIAELTMLQLAFEKLNRYDVILNEKTGKYKVSINNKPDQMSILQQEIINHEIATNGLRSTASSITSILPNEVKIVFMQKFEEVAKNFLKDDANIDHVELSVLRKIGGYKHMKVKVATQNYKKFTNEGVSFLYNATLSVGSSKQAKLLSKDENITMFGSRSPNKIYRILHRTKDTIYLQDLGKAKLNYYSYNSEIQATNWEMNSNIPKKVPVYILNNFKNSTQRENLVKFKLISETQAKKEKNLNYIIDAESADALNMAVDAAAKESNKTFKELQLSKRIIKHKEIAASKAALETTLVELGILTENENSYELNSVLLNSESAIKIHSNMSSWTYSLFKSVIYPYITEELNLYNVIAQQANNLTEEQIVVLYSQHDQSMTNPKWASVVKDSQDKLTLAPLTVNTKEARTYKPDGRKFENLTDNEKLVYLQNKYTTNCN